MTGATGKTGSVVIDELLAKGVPVRAVVHSNDARSAALERKGAETVVADMFDPDHLLAAMRGTQRAYYLPFYHPYMIQSATAFAVAAREAKLEAIVSLGQWLASPTHPSLLTRQTWLTDQVFSMMLGVAHVRVNPGYFADNYLRLIEYAAHLGLFPTIPGNSKDAPPSNEDIARVVVAALMDPDKHAGKQYRPTGPVLLSGNDMAEILSRVLRRKVRRIDLPWWLFLKASRRQNAGAFLMTGLRYYIEDHKQGAFALSAPTNDVLEVTGRPAEDFETTARRYAARPEAQRNFVNWLRTFVDFMRNPLSPGYNPERLDRELRIPKPPAPHLAMANERWKVEHGAQFTQRPATERRAMSHTLVQDSV
ncbi:MAG: NmrA family NAD(P)-binding protein [Candidatus Acidiferrales bacterium]